MKLYCFSSKSEYLKNCCINLFRISAIAFLFLFFKTGHSYSKEPELIESFIAFQTSKTSGDMFYRIMIIDEECPYLDLKNIIEKHLGLKAKYDLKKRKCYVKIPSAGGEFWIDGTKNRFGSVDKKGKKYEKDFRKNHILAHEKKLWIRYDLLSQWLPIKIIWILDRYYMRFTPQFPLLKEIIENRERTRVSDRRKLEEKKRKESYKAIEPKDNFDTELRVKLSGTLSDDDTKDDITNYSYLSCDLNSDIYKGTLKVNSLLSKTTDEDLKSSIYWRYKREGQKHFDLIEVGNIYNRSGILAPTFAVENGIHIKRLPKDEGISGYNFEGITQPGTEIDIYVNGFIAGSVKTADGKYSFKDFQVEGGQFVMLKLYFSDGSSKTEIYQISSDAGKLIPQGEWDYQVYAGESDTIDFEGQFGFLNLRYGLLDNLTIGLHTFKYPETDVSGLDLGWKPYPWLFITTEHMFADGTNGNAASIDIIFPPSSLKIEISMIDEDSPLINLQSGDKEYPDYRYLRYVINSHGWYFNFQYTDTTGFTKYHLSLKKRVNRYLSLSTENSIKEYKDDTTEDLETNTFGADIMYKKHNIRLYWTIDSHQNVSYRYQPGRDSKYYLTASCNRYEDTGEWDVFLSYTYKFNDFFSSTASLSDTYTKFESSLEGIITGEKGPDKSDQFALGTLYGVLKTPGTSSHPKAPVEGATIMAGSKRVVTDKDGKYMITGLPVNQRIIVRILPDTLDLGLTPKEEFTIFRFRPGTKIEYNPLVQRTVGIDGVIVYKGAIPEGAKIYALNIRTNKEIASAEIDSDGFFVIEGIVPGFYHLIVRGVRKKDAVFEYMVKSNIEWVSDVKLKIKN